MDRTELRQAINGWLLEGPRSLDELAARAVADGVLAAGEDDDGFEAADHIDDLIMTSDDYWTVDSQGPDERIALVSTFLDTGMTFTHRLTADELEAEAVDLAPDLSVIDWNHADGIALDDGDMLEVDHGEPGRTQLVGPPGWIERCHPGDVLAFVRTDGQLSAEVVDELGDGQAEVDALREAAARWVGGGRGEEEAPFLMEAMARNPMLFRTPVLPVGELLVAAGLERRGIEWGWAGEAWLTGPERSGEGDAGLRQRFGFDPCCDRAFDRVAETFRAHLLGDDVDSRTVADDLDHGSVTEAFIDAKADVLAAVTGFAHQLVAGTTGRHTAPALTLLGLSSCRQADPQGAVEHLEAAVRADQRNVVGTEWLAVLELDRGNLSRAHGHACHEGVDQDLAHWIEIERARQDGLRPSARRNDPCPCGSGKKFKACCAHGAPLSLSQRLPLVLHRLRLYTGGAEHHPVRFGLALSAARLDGDLIEQLGRLLQDPFLTDIAIHEGGLGELYLEERGALLADDERLLVADLLAAPQRLWEIIEVDPGQAMTLRDTGSGDELVVMERSGSVGRAPGELLLARASTVDATPMLFGNPILVPLRQRARVLRLLDGWVDADILAAWFGSLSQPPTLVNREGEDLVLRRTMLAVRAASETVLALLDETYQRQGDDQVWHELTTVDGDERIVRGTLRLDGNEVEVESNSEQRQDRIIETLQDLLDAIVLSDQDVGAEDVIESVEPGGGVQPLDDDTRALLEAQIADYERRWVDDSIPALGGLTTRQALDDPTRREDLFALLREMRATSLPDDAVGMSVDRVEHLLGISDP